MLPYMPMWPALLDTRSDMCRSVLWTCIACGAQEQSRGEPLPCLCGCEQSWFAEEAEVSASPRAVLVSELSADEIPRIRTGTPELDSLLGGGIAEGSAVFMYGRQGSGKSRCAYRWAARQRALIVCTEMAPAVVRHSLASLKAELDSVFLLSSLDGWRSEAERTRVRAVVVDSLASARSAASTVLECRDWARASGGVAYCIQHANKKGESRGTTSAPHWADYEFRISKPTPTSTSTRIEVRKVRLGPTGIVSASLA